MGRWRTDIISDFSVTSTGLCLHIWTLIVRVSHPHSFWQLLLEHEAECLGRENTLPDRPYIPGLPARLLSCLVVLNFLLATCFEI